MKEHNKAPEKIQLSNEEVANLPDEQLKTGNQDAHRIGWIRSQIRWKNEVYAKWNKIYRENIQGTNSDAKETGAQINSVDQKEETSNQKRMKKQEFKKINK